MSIAFIRKRIPPYQYDWPSISCGNVGKGCLVAGPIWSYIPQSVLEDLTGAVIMVYAYELAGQSP